MNPNAATGKLRGHRSRLASSADELSGTGADAVVFANPLTDHQRTVLAELFACPVFSHDDLAGAIDRP